MVEYRVMKELNLQEQAFVQLYLKSWCARAAALDAGYSKSVADVKAWMWVSVTSCPPNKLHVRQAVEAEIEKIYGSEQIDRQWVLKRAKMLVEFNLGKFLTTDGHGQPVYDFRNATLDDWWCIEEFATDRTYGLAVTGDLIPATKVKIKTPSKITMLKLIGDHVDVGAFKQQVELSGTTTQVVMSADEYRQVRAETLKADDV